MESVYMDKIRSLYSRVALSGIITEIDKVKKSVNKNGIPCVSFQGSIQCSEDDPVYNVSFNFYVQAKNSRGEDNEEYANVIDFLDSVKTKAKFPNNPDAVTKCCLLGGIGPQVYCGADGKVHQFLRYNMNKIVKFDGYYGRIDMEGMIMSIAPETIGENSRLTGREIMRIFGRTFDGQVIDMNRVIITSEMATLLRANKYDKNTTSTFYFDLLKNQAPEEEGGIGNVRTTGGRSWLEVVLTGAKKPEIGDKALNPTTVKMAMNEWDSYLESVKSEGYKGKKTNGGIGTPRKANPKLEEMEIDDETFPAGEDFAF